MLTNNISYNIIRLTKTYVNKLSLSLYLSLSLSLSVSRLSLFLSLSLSLSLSLCLSLSLLYLVYLLSSLSPLSLSLCVFLSLSLSLSLSILSLSLSFFSLLSLSVLSSPLVALHQPRCSPQVIGVSFQPMKTRNILTFSGPTRSFQGLGIELDFIVKQTFGRYFCQQSRLKLNWKWTRSGWARGAAVGDFTRGLSYDQWVYWDGFSAALMIQIPSQRRWL